MAATTTFTAHSRAGDPLGEIPGRPGVSVIRSRPLAKVSTDSLERLRSLAARAPSFLNASTGHHVDLMGGRFLADGALGDDELELTYVIDGSDLAAVLTSVRQARQNSNFVIFSLHSHEPTNAVTEPADMARRIAHDAVQAGADLVVGHGPHQLRGIEVCSGAPILYSLGDFAMMSNGLDAVPPETYEACQVRPGETTVPEMLAARNRHLFDSRGSSSPRSLYCTSIPTAASSASIHSISAATEPTADAECRPRRREPQPHASCSDCAT